MVQIGELSASMTPLNINQMTRWVNTKEAGRWVNTVALTFCSDGSDMSRSIKSCFDMFNE